MSSDESILPCVRFFGEPCDPENCCGGRNRDGEISRRSLVRELLEERKLEALDLTDDEVLELWRAGRLRVVL